MLKSGTSLGLTIHNIASLYGRREMLFRYYLPAEYLASSAPRMRRNADNKPSTIFTEL